VEVIWTPPYIYLYPITILEYRMGENYKGNLYPPCPLLPQNSPELLFTLFPSSAHVCLIVHGHLLFRIVHERDISSYEDVPLGGVSA